MLLGKIVTLNSKNKDLLYVCVMPCAVCFEMDQSEKLLLDWYCILMVIMVVTFQQIRLETRKLVFWVVQAETTLVRFWGNLGVKNNELKR